MEIRQFRGRIIIDRDIFDDEFFPVAWGERDGFQKVYSRISGFNIDHNLYRVSVNNRSVTKIKPFPGKKDSGYINRIIRDNANKYTAEQHYYIRAADMVHYPSAVIAYIFRDAGILFNEMQIDEPAETVFTFRVKSPKLLDILREMNKESDNLIAESLLKLLGHIKSGKQGRFEDGLESLRMFYRDIIHEGINFADGSGFSDLNRLSVRFAVELLSQEDIYPLLAESLENLSKIINIEIPRGFNIFYKTGSIYGVRALAGCILFRGRRYAFCIIINDRHGNGADFNEIGIYMKEFLSRINKDVDEKK